MGVLFERDGVERVAATPTDEVKLRYDGWKPVGTQAVTVPPQAPTPPPMTGSGPAEIHATGQPVGDEGSEN